MKSLIRNNRISTDNLKGVAKTLIIPLRARYNESKRKNGLINDGKTIEIMERIDYDFSKREVSNMSQVGMSIRTNIIDDFVSDFIGKNNEAVVVNFGCGLDTRFSRLDNGKVQWFDLDLPECIELRKNFFIESERYAFIPISVLDFNWMQKIPKNRPLLFLAEGLLMYFSKEEVKKIFFAINKSFPDCDFLFEAISPFIVRMSSFHPDLKHSDAYYKWGTKTGKDLNSWFEKEIFKAEWPYLDKHKYRWPFTLRVLSVLPFVQNSVKIIHLKFAS